MDKNKLFKRYKKKISIYFALSIFAAFWLIQAIFTYYIFSSSNSKLEEKIINKYVAVENIITKKDTYLNKSDLTTRLILEKTLENVSIYNWNNIILWNIKLDKFNKVWFYDSRNYKFYIQKLNIDNNEYTIIIKENNNLSYYTFLLNKVIFFITILPFIFIFYFIWNKFVEKNFRQIEETINSLEEFNTNINHEIKTPLSEIISTLCLAKKTKNYEEATDISINSANKINKILESLLWIISIIDLDFKKEKINFKKELENIIKENKDNISDKKLEIIKIYSNKKNSLNINKQHFYICISNIFKNAIKYSNNNWKINIITHENKIIIRDEWIWIEKENLKNIFNRYFRENYKEEKWYGIWLSLVKKIVDLNKWSINIESEKDIWTKVELIFK